MAKPGPKGKSNVLKVVAGTDQPCRERAPAVEPLEGEPVRPKWLKGLARRVWIEKVEKYQKRGQNIVGCEDALAQYCALEAELIDMRKRKVQPPVTMIRVCALSRSRVSAFSILRTKAWSRLKAYS